MVGSHDADTALKLEEAVRVADPALIRLAELEVMRGDRTTRYVGLEVHQPGPRRAEADAPAVPSIAGPRRWRGRSCRAIPPASTLTRPGALA